MNAYVIIRETGFTHGTKIVFDKRDLVEDIESCNEIAHSLWPGEYYAQLLPCDTIHPTIKIYQDEDKTVQMWETVWSTYDYKDNIVEGIFECGFDEDYMKCFQSAYESYKVMEELNNDQNE